MSVAPMAVALAPTRTVQRTGVRWTVLGLLFFVTTINFADRATLSIVGPVLTKQLGIDAVSMGYIFSAFGWAYVLAQIPGGWLLDRFGSKRVYAASIFLWSLFTLAQGFVGHLSGFAAVATLFALRFFFGLAEGPSFPGNSRIVSAWFPTAERGTAAAVFNSAQYFATAFFTPLMAWLVHALGWPHVFTIMGTLGIITSGVWLKVIHSPRTHPRINAAEFAYIENGGALVDLEHTPRSASGAGVSWRSLQQLLGNRMLVGIYLAQFCITTITYFFLTWFPVYLVQQRGMSILKAGFVAVLPALCGLVGGVLGGIFSDYLLKRGCSLSVARKTPIVAGMLMSTSMIACNYTNVEGVVVAIMALAFFGKGVGALGWAVVSDTSPKEIAGLSGGLFNTFGNTAAITTPIVIGYIVQGTGSFNGALVFVGLTALGAIFSYLFIVGEIKRVQLQPLAAARSI